MTKYEVSVIIPCRNEEKYIAQCLNSILNSDFPSDAMEIIVVDGMSTDRTAEIVEGFSSTNASIVLLRNPEKIVPVSMNMGMEAARGNVIVRLDAHAAYPNDYISTLLKWKKELNATNIGCPIKTEVLNKTPKSLAIIRVLSNKFGVGNGLFRIGVNEPVEVDTVPFGCFDKEFVQKIGGYNPKLLRNQDIELNNRIKNHGGKIILIPYTNCTYYARETWKGLAKNNFSNGKWNLRTVYITKNISSLGLRHFMPLFFILSLILPTILAAFYFPAIYLSGLSLAAYLLAIVTIVSKTNRADTTFFHLAWTFIVLHFSYGFGSLVGLFYFPELFKK